MLSNLFPSRTLTLYLVRLFIVRILGVLVMLVLVLQALQLLSESGDILAVPGNGQAELWRYVSLNAPQLMARFLPYSVLLATLFTFAPLNQNSEVIAMRAGGLSAHQILAPMLLTAAAVSLVSLVFNETVVAPATGTLKQWNALKYQPVPKDTGVRYNVYVPDGTNVLAAASVTGTGPNTVLDQVSWYRRDGAGMVTEQLRSRRATYAAPGWRLDNPVHFDVATTTQVQLPTQCNCVTEVIVSFFAQGGDGHRRMLVTAMTGDRATRRAQPPRHRWSCCLRGRCAPPCSPAA